MRFWPRRKAGDRAEPPRAEEDWGGEPDPRQAYYDQFGGSAPRFMADRGPARIYEDEVDEEWRDPWTEPDDEDAD